MILIARLWTMLDGGAVVELQVVDDNDPASVRYETTRRRWVGPGVMGELKGSKDLTWLLGREISAMTEFPPAADSG